MFNRPKPIVGASDQSAAPRVPKSIELKVLHHAGPAPDSVQVSLLRAGVVDKIRDYLEATGESGVAIAAEDMIASLAGRSDTSQNQSQDKDAPKYEPSDPLYTFEHLIVPETTRTELDAAVSVISVESKVFDEWGLRKIEPFPRTALNLHGAPGTGKTLAAHALASKLGRKIIIASYAEIESKFHGDGPKNVKALFKAADDAKAVLFIDEADSLLSARLTNVTQGSEQAINSMRSQLLICLEQFTGIAVFSTNLAENYDKAFETRVRHVHFELPDERARALIWRNHLPETLPQAADVDTARLAREVDDICGREIKSAVIDAAVRAAIAHAIDVKYDDLKSAILRIKAARIGKKKPTPVSDSDLTARISKAVAEAPPASAA